MPGAGDRYGSRVRGIVGGPTERSRRRLARVALAHPLWTVAVAYLLLRLADLVVFAVVARSHGIGLRRVLMGWDGGWYLRSALEGYPDRVPTDAAGEAIRSTLAWPPVFPWLGHLGAAVLPAHPTGGASVVMVAVSAAGGLVAAWMLCLALLPSFGASRAIGSAVVWAALPATPVFVMGYSEGLFSALVFASLWATTRRRYVLAGALLLPAGLIRVTVLPFAVALVVAMVVDRRRTRSVPLARMAAATVLAAAGTVGWPVLLGLREGSPNAYAFAQSAWGRSSVPFAETLQWLRDGWQQVPTMNSVVAAVTVVVYLVAAVVVSRDRQAPLAVRVLAVVAPVFVIASGAVASTVRYFVPDPALAITVRRWVPRTALLVAVIVLISALRVSWILAFPAAPPDSMPP